MDFPYVHFYFLVIIKTVSEATLNECSHAFTNKTHEENISRSKSLLFSLCHSDIVVFHCVTSFCSSYNIPSRDVTQLTREITFCFYIVTVCGLFLCIVLFYAPTFETSWFTIVFFCSDRYLFQSKFIHTRRRFHYVLS